MHMCMCMYMYICMFTNLKHLFSISGYRDNIEGTVLAMLCSLYML